MSERKWTVIGTVSGWIVIHPGDVCRGSDGLLNGWRAHSRHDTWADAMQEADRMARTVTVTLPRVGEEDIICKCAEFPITILQKRTHTRIRSGDHRLSLYHDELEPVALALLAHARRKETP